MANNRQTKKRSGNAPRRSEQDDAESVGAYLNSLDHPLKPVMESIRLTILKADGRVTEGIKWNSPSFYCNGWFATFNLRAKQGIMVVLHHGAKTRGDNTLSLTIDDSSKLLTWLAKDRAVVTFTGAEDFKSRQKAFKKIIKQWVEYQAGLPNLV